MALPTEERVEEVPDARLIVDHQNFGHGSSRETGIGSYK
jgi:3-isopropylmalate dehydratase small subunit